MRTSCPTDRRGRLGRADRRRRSRCSRTAAPRHVAAVRRNFVDACRRRGLGGAGPRLRRPCSAVDPLGRTFHRAEPERPPRPSACAGSTECADLTRRIYRIRRLTWIARRSRRRRPGSTSSTRTKLTRALYSSDASLYRVVPLAVARPAHGRGAAGSVLDAARALGMPVTTRGAGTSCAGNAVGPGLVVDTVAAPEHDPSRSTPTRGPPPSSRAWCRPPAARGGAVRAAVRARSVHPHPLHDRRDDRQQRLRSAGAGLRPAPPTT